MAYYIDLEKISVEQYQNKLKYAYLPPGRMILKERLDERFEYFEDLGIENVKELMQLLNNKDRFAELSAVECLSEDYLTVLLREIRSTLPKPNKLSDFIEISEYTIRGLEKIGITNTEKLYNQVLKKTDRQKLAELTGLKYQEILELTKLADLSRMKWVGVTYAQMLYDLGADSVEKVSESDPVDLHARLNQMIKEKNIFKGAIGLNDVRILIESAGELSVDIEY